MISSHTLPADLDALVRDELQPDERVVFAEQPLAARRVLRAFALWIFAVPWTAFSAFWTAAAASGVSSWLSWQVLFPLWGVPFVAIGVAMLSAPAWAWRGARRSLYVVTDRRAVLFESQGGRAIGVRAFPPEALGDPRRVERPDGSGDLLFAQTTTRDSDGDRITTSVGFTGVADVKEAARAVAALAATAAPRGVRPVVPRGLGRGR